MVRAEHLRWALTTLVALAALFLVRFAVEVPAGREALIDLTKYGGRTPQQRQAQLKRVSRLLERGANPNTMDESGEAPLHYAVGDRNLPLIQVLAKHGADPDQANQEGLTPIDAAMSWDSVPAVQLMLADGSHWTLPRAAFVGDQAKVQELLRARVPVEEASYEKRTALHWAALRGDCAMAEVLLAHGGNPAASDGFGRTPLQYAAEGAHGRLVHLLLERHAPVAREDNGGRTALTFAALNGDRAVVRLLLAHGARWDALAAVYLDEADILHRLLTEHARLDIPDAKGRPPLSVAAARGATGLVRLLLDHRLPAAGEVPAWPSPLMLAAGAGHTATVALLLDRGAMAGGGIMSLIWAIDADRMEVSRLLLRRGANVNGKLYPPWPAPFDPRGPLGPPDLNLPPGPLPMSPLMVATRHGNLAMVRLLLQYGADPRLANDSRETPLHTAARGGGTEIAALLLAHGADVNALDAEGRTPLDLAVKAGDRATACLLLAHGGTGRRASVRRCNRWRA